MPIDMARDVNTQKVLDSLASCTDKTVAEYKHIKKIVRYWFFGLDFLLVVQFVLLGAMFSWQYEKNTEYHGTLVLVHPGESDKLCVAKSSKLGTVPNVGQILYCFLRYA